MTTKTLSHIRVLDLTRILAGPWCTQNLADLGAEVIKIERPGSGDDTRQWGPPWVHDANGGNSTDSTYYAAANRGKKSLTVDIAKPEGQALVRELAKQCDVLIENFKVGDLARYGLDYDSLSAINPGLVYCSITGYGQDGPKAHLPGYDIVFQAIGGLMSITGEADDKPGGGPQKVGIAIADVMTGQNATIAILAALSHRGISGRGQHLDISLLDSIVAIGGNQVTGYFASGKVPHRYGNAHATMVPYQVFDTADGQIVVAAGNNVQWRRFCEAIGRPGLATDPEFARMEDRITRRDTLIPQLEETIKMRTNAEWTARLEEMGVPCGAINNYKQVFEDPQVVHRGMRVDLRRADGATVGTVASPLRMSGTPVTYEQAPPLLGEHTDEVLSRLLEKNAEEITALRNRGIV